MFRPSRGLPFVRRERDSLFLDLAFGAVGGALGTWLMSPAMRGFSKVMPQKLRQQAEQQGAQQSEGATEKLARKVLEPFGIQLEGERKKKVGNLLHYGYGIAWGALHGALHRRVPLVGKLFGLGFGLGLFVLGDEVLVPSLKLGPPPLKTPLATHLSALAAHFVYGSAAESGYRVLRRALT
jgi:hypothetical protein